MTSETEVEPEPIPATEPTHRAEPGTVAPPSPSAAAPADEEIGGPKGPEPTRYGDWERKGRCIDF